MFALGAVLFLAGGFYGVWATQRLRTTSAVEETAAFDVPVARLAWVFAARQARLVRVSTSTALERALLDEARVQGDAAARLGLCLLRVLLATVGLTTGLLLMVVVLAQRPLVRMLENRPP